MKKLLILLIYPIALTFTSIAYSAGATVTLESNSKSGIPFLINSDNSNLKDMKLLERKTNETKMNQYDRALKYGYLKSIGDKKNKRMKSKKDKRSLNYFVFDYTFDVSNIKNLNMISNMSYESNPKKSLYLIGENETTGAQNVFKIKSMNLTKGKLIVKTACGARYSLSNPSLVKSAKKSVKQLDVLNNLAKKKARMSRQQNFQYTRFLNESCFISTKGKNRFSFKFIDSGKVPLSLKKQLSGPQYSK